MSTEKTKKKSQRNLTLIIITALTIISWIGFEAYRTYVMTKVKPETRSLLTPLRPAIEKDILTRLESGLGLPREEVENRLPMPSLTITDQEASASLLPSEPQEDLLETKESSLAGEGIR